MPDGNLCGVLLETCRKTTWKRDGVFKAESESIMKFVKSNVNIIYPSNGEVQSLLKLKVSKKYEIPMHKKMYNLCEVLLMMLCYNSYEPE